MKKHLSLILTFVPWVVFSEMYAPDPKSALTSTLIAIATTLIVNYKEIRKKYVLPIASIVYFMLVAINSFFDFIPWVLTHPAALVNLALALIVWFSLAIKQPFTLQYAKEEVDPIYWKNKLFITINYRLTLMWAIVLSMSAIPAILIPEIEYDGSFFWNYGLNIVCILIALYLNKAIPNQFLARNFWSKVKKLPQVNSKYLKGGFAPVHDEVFISNLEVIGKLPEDLTGRYLRNGPNPYFTPYTYTYPIDGDGMIHQIEFAHGQVSYKNKFVMTKGLQDEIKANKALFGGINLPIPPDPRKTKENAGKNTAAIHIINWQDKLLALYEGNSAYLLDNQLNTLGELTLPEHSTPLIVNAHHRIDHATKQMYMFSYGFNTPLTVYEFNDKYELIKEIPINKKRYSMIHDFVLTQNHLVFIDTPAIFNFRGNDGTKPFFYYDKQQTVTIYLINRHDYSIKTIKNIPSFFVYHFVNGYEIDNKITFDFIHHDELMLNESDKHNPPHLYKGEIDLTKLSYNHYILNQEYAVEFPNYNLQLTAKPYQYAYLSGTKTRNGFFNTLIKYNVQTNVCIINDFGADIEIGEICYVPKKDTTAEDDGYLMFFAYNKTTDTSDFMIMDAKNPLNTIAQIKLNRRVPHGLHGSFFTTLS